MEATPFAQAGDWPTATKCTGELAVVPLEGELTNTPAKEGIVKIAKRHTMSRGFPTFI
jgi:hypothetical protein